MLHTISALLIDDDIWSLRLLKGMLQQCFPDLRVEARTVADTSGNFDIYFIDNLIGGVEIAADLAAEIRERRPDALIIAFSARLDQSTPAGAAHRRLQRCLRQDPARRLADDDAGHPTLHRGLLAAPARGGRAAQRVEIDPWPAPRVEHSVGARSGASTLNEWGR
jgi:hypothetical protein